MEVSWTETHGGQSGDDYLESVYKSKKDVASWKLRIDDPGPDDLFDDPVYVRGAMALQALRNKIGDATFWTLLQTWVSTRAGGNGSVDDFVELAETVSGQDLRTFFDTWLHSTSRPTQTVANGF